MNCKRVINYFFAVILCCLTFTTLPTNVVDKNSDLIEIIKSHIHFTLDMIESLKTIRNSAAASDKTVGLMGQWGDSNTNTAIFIEAWYNTPLNHTAYTGFNYWPILSWMGGGRTSMPNEGFKNLPYNGSGWGTNSIINMAQEAIDAQKPSWVHLNIGTNDAAGLNAMDAATYEVSLRSILDITIENGVIPTLSTIICRESAIPQKPYRRFDRTIEFNNVIKKLSSEYKIPYIDLAGLFTDLYPDGGWNTILLRDDIHYSYAQPKTGGNNGAAIRKEADLRMNGYELWNVLVAELALRLKEQVFR